jgi:hypothetical protein
VAERKDILSLVLSWSMDAAPSDALRQVSVLGAGEAEGILREFGTA